VVKEVFQIKKNLGFNLTWLFRQLQKCRKYDDDPSQQNNLATNGLEQQTWVKQFVRHFG